MSRTPFTRPVMMPGVVWDLRYAILESLPARWESATYLGNFLGSAEQHSLIAVNADDVKFRIEVPEQLKNVVRALRRTEYTPELGVWFGLQIELRSTGSGVTIRNYGMPPVFDGPVPGSAYAEELSLLPRVDEAIPDWLREKAGLQSTTQPTAEPADGAEQASATGDAQPATGDSAAPAWQPPRPERPERRSDRSALRQDLRRDRRGDRGTDRQPDIAPGASGRETGQRISSSAAPCAVPILVTAAAHLVARAAVRISRHVHREVPRTVAGLRQVRTPFA